MWRILLIFLALFAGYWAALQKPEKVPEIVFQSTDSFPLTENKSFVFVVYAQNDAPWCERSLRSIFEQDYEQYRVILIDDHSMDQSAQKAKKFILDNQQEAKAIVIENEQIQGEVAALYRAVHSCLDKEIIVFLRASDWLSSPLALTKLNAAYQNPDVWVTKNHAMGYPTYEQKEEEGISFYAAIFKQILLEDLFEKGGFAKHPSMWERPLLSLASHKMGKITFPIQFINQASYPKNIDRCKEPIAYAPLKAFPEPFQSVDAE